MFKFLVIAALLGITFAAHPQGLRVRQVQKVSSHSGLVKQRVHRAPLPQRAHSIPVQHRQTNGHDDVEITRLASQVNEDGTYGFEYELSNGVAAQESGVGGQHASGSFRHISPEGEQIQLTYTADENGFHPQGAHLPTPPPIPNDIIRAIQYIEAHPTAEEQQNRQIRLQHNQ